MIGQAHIAPVLELLSNLPIPISVSPTYLLTACMYHEPEIRRGQEFPFLKWNEMNRALGHLCAHIGYTGPGEEVRMVRWLRWHCLPDTGFEIRALAVWGRARYLSVTEAPHNTDFYTWMGKKRFLFLSNRRDREPNPELVKGSGDNHYPPPPFPLVNGGQSLALLAPVFTLLNYCWDWWNWDGKPTKL